MENALEFLIIWVEWDRIELSNMSGRVMRLFRPLGGAKPEFSTEQGSIPPLEVPSTGLRGISEKPVGSDLGAVFFRVRAR